MKVGRIINTNKKGQMAIPQEYRDLFGIDSSVPLNIIPYRTGLFIQPVKKVLPEISSTDVYGEILEKTTGAWGKLKDETKEKGKREIELAASKKKKARMVVLDTSIIIDHLRRERPADTMLAKVNRKEGKDYLAVSVITL